jgi:predicted HicB family RNase H-like nuclease
MRKITKKSTKTESTNPEIAAEAPSPTKKGSHGDKKILSIAIDPQLHARLALAARCEGRSVTDLVVEAVSKNLKARIAAALETLKADLDK